MIEMEPEEVQKPDWKKVGEIQKALSNFLSDGNEWNAESEEVATALGILLFQCHVPFERVQNTIRILK